MTPESVTRTGNLTTDPKPGEGNGTRYARFTIAVETPREGNDWKGELVTTFYECTAFGSIADHACESLTKGDRVIVVGKPSTDTWTGRDNQPRTTKKIEVNDLGAELRFATVTIERKQRGGVR